MILSVRFSHCGGIHARDIILVRGITQRLSLIPFTVIVSAAAAIAIHNFPEGIAAFIVGLATPKLGIAVAVAIAIHNIPEGASVAIPIYYATGKKWKGFLWAFLSGISEPFGKCKK